METLVTLTLLVNACFMLADANKIETKSLASINAKNVLVREDPEIDAQGSVNKDGVSYLSIPLYGDARKENVRIDCIARGFNSLGDTVVVFDSLNTRRCEDNREYIKKFCRPLFKYSQSRYCISNFLVKNISAAIHHCNLVGGYLAEISDRNEYLAVQSEFNKAAIDIMLIGGSDAYIEGSWMYQHSGSPVSFFDWSTGQPDNAGEEDCLEIRKRFAPRMNDIPCFNSVHGDSNFVCEIKDK